MSTTKAKPAPEVIQDWADGEGGYTFERGRMEAAVRGLCFENPVKLHTSAKVAAKPAIKLKREDVDFIVSSASATSGDCSVRLSILVLTDDRTQGATRTGGRGFGRSRRQRDKSAGAAHDTSLGFDCRMMLKGMYVFELYTNRH